MLAVTMARLIAAAPMNNAAIHRCCITGSVSISVMRKTLEANKVRMNETIGEIRPLGLPNKMRPRGFALQLNKPLDEIDWRILAELQADGRLSYNQLARRVNLSAPAVADRVRRLEEAGVIAGYQALVDPRRAGLPITAFIHLRCTLGKCLLKTSTAEDYPEVAEVHKLSGSHCTLLEVRAASLQHFEGLVERIGEHGAIETHIVLSTQYEGRPVAPVDIDRPVSNPIGWPQR
ncbi:Lrp/AsnC family transcriptional regulator [Nocardia sp. CA-107356]|uniref:Lrp/AsnC family transcriptional regulator n=1 Tax=Nocardia sp. CA-107356 TaxID=3239972 RepID=UPI003D942960